MMTQNRTWTPELTAQTRAVLAGTAPDAPSQAVSACCASEKQAVCCEPSEKEACCGTPAKSASGCGCQ